MSKLLRYFFIGILLPVLVQYVCYYQFTTNYTTNAFSKESFTEMYNSSVYKSRIIGKELQLFTYQQLEKIEKIRNLRNAADSDLLLTKKRLQFMDPTADPVFYLTYFLLATIFTILTSVLLLRIFDIKEFFPQERQTKDLVICFFILLTGLTQFVVTPYDNPGYFFMALGIYLFLQYLSSGRVLYFVSVSGVILVATFNRETSLLLLSFIAAIYFTYEGFKIAWIRRMILPVLCFLIPYLYLKFFYNGGASITEESKLAVNLDITNSYAIRGLAFGAFLLYFMLSVQNKPRSKFVLYFLIFSLPYIIIIHAVGVMIEYRLWMPVLLGALVISMLPLRMGKIQASVPSPL